MPEEEKKEDDKIILEVDIDCQGCKAKVYKALREFTCIEGVRVNIQDHKVIIEGGKLDARQVCETVQKKSGRRTVLVYPDIQKLADDEKKAKEQTRKEEPTPQPEMVVVLKVNMHCAACAKQIRKSLSKVDGVTDAKEDFAKCIVTVTGKNLDSKKLCARVRKRSGKYCEVVSPPLPPVPPKEEQKKGDVKPADETRGNEEDEAKPVEEAKKEDEKHVEAVATDAPEEAKAKAKEEEKKDEHKAAAEEKKEKEGKEKTDAQKEEEKKEEPSASEETKTEVKKYEYIAYRSVQEYYVYPPQIFSDENPNACSIM